MKQKKAASTIKHQVAAPAVLTGKDSILEHYGSPRDLGISNQDLTPKEPKQVPKQHTRTQDPHSDV